MFLTKNKLLGLALLVFLIMFGFLVKSNVKDQNDVPSSGGELIKIGGIVKDFKWYRTEKSFHYIIRFENSNMLIHSKSVFLGAVHVGDKLKLECKKYNSVTCGNAVLYSYKPNQQKPAHRH